MKDLNKTLFILLALKGNYKTTRIIEAHILSRYITLKGIMHLSNLTELVFVCKIK